MTKSSLRKLHLRQLIDAIDDAVLILDLDDEQVIDANERACSLYAIARREIGGAALKTLSEDFVHWAPILRAKLRESRSYRFETVRRRRDGSEISLQVHTTVLAEGIPIARQKTDPAAQQTGDLSATMASGGAPHVVVAMKDITDIVTLEASARRNERVAEMGHLVGAVAHEVRNPLFVISAS